MITKWEWKKTTQAENLFEALFQSPLNQQHIINLSQFQWQGIVKNATGKKSFEEKAQVSPKEVL